MERELPPYRAAVTKPARASIWPTIAITAVLLAVAGCGVYLIGQTHARWEKNRADKAARIAEFERQWKAQQSPSKTAPYVVSDPAWEHDQREMENLFLQRERDLRSGKLRCINHQVFRRLPNGWEHLPGDTC